MRQIVFHDAEGRILRVVASETAPPAQYGPEQHGSTAHLICEATPLIDGHAFRVVDGSLQPRPALPGLSIPTTAPAVIDLSGLPEGTVLRITNAPGDMLEIDDFSEALTLTEPGPYTMRLTPPFPWAARTLSVVLGAEGAGDA